MRKWLAAIGGSVFGSLLFVAAVGAAQPTVVPSPTASAGRGTVAQVLSLTQEQIRELRQDGLSLAQIAERQKVSIQSVINVLTAAWQARIDTRVQAGALTTQQATELKAQLQTRATQMVNSTAPGGMRGAAVGAGPHAGNGSGPVAPGGYGDGTCDGTGPHGQGRP